MQMSYPRFVASVLFASAFAAGLLFVSDTGLWRAAAATPVPDAALRQQCIDGAAVGTGRDELAGDCALLLESKDALRGTATLNWSADTAIANWTGVTVGGTPERVTALRLSWRSLSGSIPAQLTGLTELRGLQLQSNALTGTIPAGLGSLGELDTLYLDENQLTGAIPAELGNLSNLKYLGLHTNRLDSAIPAELGNLTRLQYLYLENNQLSGSIPVELGDLELRSLYLGGNQFTGCIPAALMGVSGDLATLGLSYCAAITTQTLMISATGVGWTDPATGTHSYRSGAQVGVEAVTVDGYRVASWGGDCAGTPVTDNRCELTMDIDRTASVTFEQVTYSLTVTAIGGGSVTPGGTTTQFAGREVTLTAMWDSATHAFREWGGDCSGTGPTCLLTMDADKTVTATFSELATYGLTTSAGANGSIDPPPGLHSYTENTSVTLTATPDSGYQVASWGGDCSTSGAAPTCVLTVDADRTASVTFEAITYTLTISRGSNGHINPAPGTHSYSENASVTVTATPHDGYRVASWEGDCRASGTDRSCVLTMDSDKTVEVTFGTLCENGTAVPNYASEPGLVQDCDRLLALRDTLAGTGTLNWSADSVVTSWTGVTVGGTPQRVTDLSLASSGLTGQLSGLVGDLTGLTELRLNGNTLTGGIPSKLGQLVNLTHAYLAGNTLTGCVPAWLGAVANNDIASLGLSACAAPTDISFGEHTLTEGTYQFLLGPASPPLIFDVPAGVSLEILGITRAALAPGSPPVAPGLLIQQQNGRSWICLDTLLGGECSRWTETTSGNGGARTSNPNSAPSIGTLFDRIADSTWLGVPSDTLGPPIGTRDIGSHLGTGASDEEWWHIARNVIIGEPIVVCTESGQRGYSNATAGAVAMWNDALRRGPPRGAPYIEPTTTVFQVGSACPSGAPSGDKIDYVNVYGAYGGTLDCNAGGCPPRDVLFLCTNVSDSNILGCFLSNPRSGAPLYTFVGKQTVILNTFFHRFADDGHDGSTNVVEQQRYDHTLHTMAHELGHALGLPHISVPNPYPPRDFNCDTAPGVLSCWDKRGRSYPLTQADFDLYRALYKPNLVVPLTNEDDIDGEEWELPFVENVSGKPGTIRFNFDATNVGSEHKIQIRPKTGATWGATIAEFTATANPLQRWEYPAHTGGVYGIFSTTHAYADGQVRLGTTPIGFVREVGVGIDPKPPVTPAPSPIKPPPGPIPSPGPIDPNCTLTVTSDSGGTTELSPETVDCGESITVTATADSCHVFTGWTGDVVSSDPAVDITITGVTEIHAGFEHDGTTRTLDVRVTGSGTTTGSGTYPACHLATATATADAGWRFERWEPVRFGTRTPVPVWMRVSGWIRAHFERDVVASGSFTVNGTGVSQGLALADATDQAASEAARLGADHYWRTSISYDSTTTVRYLSAAEVRWEITGTEYGISGGGFASEAAALSAAIANATADVPSGASVTGTTTDTYYAGPPWMLGGGWYAEAYVSWRESDSAGAFGEGPTAAAAEADAFANASVFAPSDATITGVGYLTQRSDETIHTATAGYSWESYRGQRAATESGSSTGDEDLPPPAEPEPY